MICKKCGSEVAEDDVFCMQCGEKIERLQCPHCGAAADEDDVFCTACGARIAQRCCPNCGNELDAESKFCIFCGAQVDGTQEMKPHVTEPKRQASPMPTRKREPKTVENAHDNTKMVWAIVALISLIIVVAIACFGYGDDVAKDEIAEDRYTADELYDNTEEYLGESEDFDDYLGSWVTYLDGGGKAVLNVWKEAGEYWISMDAVTSSNVFYPRAILDYLDEDLGLASGMSDDEYYYFDVILDFSNGMLLVSVDIIEKDSGYELDFEDLDFSRGIEEDDEYIFPDSDYEYLQRWELEGLSKEDLKIARNEIYARHGRMFQDAGLQAYFNSCSWYTPSIAPEDFKESMLNEVEIANRDMIVAYEKEMGYR